MEDKKMNEKESLELISQMIQQTKQDSAIGSGDMFLMWGYLCAFVSLTVVAMAYFGGGGHWGWLYFAIPLVGFTIAGVMAGRMKKKYNAPATYATKSINSIWGCLSCVFAVYALYCLLHFEHPEGWTGMFMLGMLLPGIGTYCTGVILKEKVVQNCGLFVAVIGLLFLRDLCENGPVVDIKWPIIMAVCMVIGLVVPGHYLNHKSKKLKA